MILKNNKENLIIFFISSIILFYFHFYFINFDRTIFSFPEVELIAIYHALLFNDGFSESYDHPGYTLFYFLSILIRLFNFLNILEISSLSKAFIYDLEGDEFKKIFYFLRVHNYIINILIILIILKIFDNYKIDKFFKISFLIILLLIPNFIFLTFLNHTIQYGFFLLALSIYFLSKKNTFYKINFFLFSLFLILAVYTKIQFLPYIFIFPALILFFKFNSLNHTKIKNINHYKFNNFFINLGLALLLITIIGLLLLLLRLEVLNYFHFLVLIFYSILCLLFYVLNKGNSIFFEKLSLIGFAFFFANLFLSLNFISNNFKIIYDPLFSNSAFFEESNFLEFKIINILNSLRELYFLYFLKIDFKIFESITDQPINYISLKPYYLTMNLTLIYYLYKKNLNMFLLNFGLVFSILLVLLINTSVRVISEFSYSLYTDILCFSFVIYFLKFNILDSKIRNIIFSCLLILTILINFNFTERNIKIRDVFGLNNSTIKEDLYQHCSRKPYLSRIQYQINIYTDFFRLNEQKMKRYRKLKSVSDNWFFSVCNKLK
jgi:hypothetical protein